MAETDNKSNSPIISELEYNMIFDRVLRHIPNLHINVECVVAWRESLEYVERLQNHPLPDIYIYTIKNEMRAMEGVYKLNSTNIKKSYVISLMTYVALYYLHKTDEQYRKVMRELVERMGIFNTNTWFNSKTDALLEKLPPRSEIIEALANCKTNSEEAEDPDEEKSEKKSSDQLCVKVLIRMFEKLWPKLGMSGCNNHQKAQFLADISGYDVDVLYDRLSRNFQLTERDHKIDIEKANTHLKLIGVARALKADINNSKNKNK